MNDPKFVFFLPNTDYYQIPYFGLKNEKNTQVVDALLDSDNKIKRFFYLAHMSEKINRRIQLPFKKLWYSSYYKEAYDGSEYFFVFFDAQLRKCTKEYKEYLQRHYPGCHIILFLTDQISTFENLNKEETFDFADLILTYEKNDAKKYKITYYPDVYSKLPNSILESNYLNSDLIFVGYKKNRVDSIIGVYEKAEKAGLNNFFVVPDIDDNRRKISAERISYIDYLRHVNKCKCILEIEQNNATGYTLRTLEALAYNKKLLTNNKTLRKALFYDPNQIQVFDDINKIDMEWIKKSNGPFDDRVIEQFSTHKLIQFISGYFDNEQAKV